MYQIIQEGSSKIYIPTEKKISKKLPVFYNPVMKFNRDISILLLKQFPPLRLCDPLAATGVRAIRFAKELDFVSITANDYDRNSINIIKKNMKLNKVKFKVHNEEANLFLLTSEGFDYIDIDPFGSPNQFLDSALKRLSRNGILAVTATDLAPLCGTIPKACIRKYWAVPKRSPDMHEIGLRILIRKIQLIGAQYEKALIPIFSYYKNHYFRIFFKNIKGKQNVDRLLKEHGMYNEAGPLYFGSLFDSNLVKKMNDNYLSIKNQIDEKISVIKIKNNKTHFGSGNNNVNILNKELEKFLKMIYEESKKNIVGFYDTHVLCKRYHHEIPKKSLIIKKIGSMNYFVSETHFSDIGIKTDMPEKKLVEIIKKIKLK